MPGKKDFVSVRQGEKRLHVQKQLILSNLKEVYRAFRTNIQMRRLAFQNLLSFVLGIVAILAGASGTHSVLYIKMLS